MSKLTHEYAASEGVARTVGELADRLVRKMEASRLLDPEREATEIIAALLDVPRFWPAANGGTPISPDLGQAAVRAAERRAIGAPLAYAVGRAAFRHLTLEVDESVLIPRVETELLVDRLLERCDAGARTVADIGTGSGAIALSLAFEREFACVIGTDISFGALAVARKNLDLLGPALRSPVKLLQGSLLAPLRDCRVDVVVSNPPYIAYAEGSALPRSVRDWEPAIALVCGEDGLAITRNIIAQAPAALTEGGILALEVDVRRAGVVAELIAVEGSYAEVEVLLDLSGRERFVFARRS